MSKKLFVAGLSFNISDAEFEQHFAQVGTVVSARIIVNHDTGKSKGFGFVEMSTEAEAQAAIDQLNNTDFAGRTIVVKEARPQNA
ncbi:MAG: RNA-binding protein [Nitrosopumilus sp.]|nr:RNA-binding protein [Nitrosopumilus sp.]MBA3551151.1 RNA-binding protein [Patescibacteria group bacterium]